MTAPEDVRSIPNYTFLDAARIAGASAGCVRRWVGSVWQLEHPRRHGPWRASYYDVVSSFVVAFLRHRYRYSLHKVRQIYRIGQRHFGIHNIFLHRRLMHDGKYFFLDLPEGLCTVDLRLQYTAKEMVHQHLQHVGYDSDGWVDAFYPLGDRPGSAEILVSPSVEYGFPILRRTKIRTSALTSYYLAGDSPEYIMDQFEITRREFNLALRFELGDAAASIPTGP